MIWFSASWTLIILPNSVGLPGFPLRMISVVCSNRLTILPSDLVMPLMSQTRARIIKGITKSEGKIVSLFEHTTEIIRKGKPGKPTEFGKMIKVQEAENQIIVAYEVYDQRRADS